jgi:molybdenum transport protein
MSFFISEHEIDKIIEEDINPLDLTSHILGMHNFQAGIAYQARHDMVVCCTEEVDRLCRKVGLHVTEYLPSGTGIKAGDVFFRAHGRGDHLHLAWRNALRVFESYCGVATRTRDLVEAVKRHNPDISVVTTRKSMPGTKKLAIKAVVSGGAYPHRLGLSETVLIFDAHIDLYGGKESIIRDAGLIKKQAKEKKVGIEAHDHESALSYAMAGFDFIQLDKFTPADVKKFSLEAKSVNPGLTVVAAGNIVPENAEQYALSGADVLVTSSLYFGRPADIKAVIAKI